MDAYRETSYGLTTVELLRYQKGVVAQPTTDM